MKKYAYLLLALLGAAWAGGCSSSDDDPAVDPALIGSWHLLSSSDQAPDGYDIYLDFAADGRCVVYQQLTTSAYVKYPGTYRCDGTVLSGRYDDGTPWGVSYDFEVAAGGNTLLLVSRTGIAEESVYVRTVIPDEVLAAPAPETFGVRAGMARWL